MQRQRPPSIDALARSLSSTGLEYPIRVAIAREATAGGTPSNAHAMAAAAAQRRPARVINATGVLCHTNLGRAPRHDTPRIGYTNVEFDLATGSRGSRQAWVADQLCELTGADAAHVVNNGAAALFLVLAALGTGRRTVVSRGELVEIGDSFRIPDICRSAGTELVEVGTTNRTRLADYDDAVDDEAIVLKVHRSNFAIVGFTAETNVAELSELGRPIVADIGSGLLDATCPWLPGPPPAWLAGEPGARQTLAAGATIVTFSGDKLLGGPQAGIIIGGTEEIAACRRHPLARVVRPGSPTLAALEQTLRAYLDRTVTSDVPLWRYATTPLDQLRRRAAVIVATQPDVLSVVDTSAVVGGGSTPSTSGIPSVAISAPGDQRATLRAMSPAIVARSDRGRTLCDLRAVEPADDGLLTAALHALAHRKEPL